MYSVVLLVALGAAEESPGLGKRGYPTPDHHGSSWPGGYHTLNGGYLWPGYACWGGCGGYAGPAYGYPMTPLVIPRPPLPYKLDEEEKKKRDDNGDKDKPDGKKKPDPDDDAPPKKLKPKEDPDEDDRTAALITFFLPAGAKLSVDGRPVNASGVKTFITPALERGRRYYYEVTIEVTRDGGPAVETRRLSVQAGESVHADYRHLSGSVTAKR